MGTRGLLAFHHQNRTLVSYNHADSYPGGLGLDVLHFLRTALENPQTGLPELRQRVSALRLVDHTIEPQTEDIESLKPYTSLNVGSGDTKDWYCLLRYTQGEPESILKAGYVQDYFDFGYKGGLCEWAYVIDLDGYALDVYEGFYTGSEPTGLWSTTESRESRGDPDNPGDPDNSRPITRIAGFPLFDLPTDEEFLAQTDPPEPENPEKEDQENSAEKTTPTQTGGIDLVVQANSALPETMFRTTDFDDSTDEGLTLTRLTSSPLALHRERLIKVLATATDHVIEWDTDEATGDRVSGCYSCTSNDYPCSFLVRAADAVLAIAVDLDSPRVIDRITQILAHQFATNKPVEGTKDFRIDARAVLAVLLDLAGGGE